MMASPGRENGTKKSVEIRLQGLEIYPVVSIIIIQYLLNTATKFVLF